MAEQWTNVDLIHWRIYVAIGEEEFELISQQFQAGRDSTDKYVCSTSILTELKVSICTEFSCDIYIYIYNYESLFKIIIRFPDALYNEKI